MTDALLGRKIGNFALRSLIGEGGMGAVFVAEHALIGRKVAIKVLRPELSADSKLVTRFVNEARAASAIAHPNIVEIFDAGTMEDGRPYIVMELLAGESLATRLSRSGTIPLVEALDYFQQAATALTVAHGIGIVHRDLKPDNIFLVPQTGAQGRSRVKLLDFGIAKLTADSTSASVRTKAGMILGTPAYMSPEQCLGKVAEVDHRTDVYAMGIILFEMLCGAPPFVCEGFGEYLMHHISMAPPRPRSRNPEIPLAVEQAILRALEKRRDDRFPTVAAFQSALTGGEPTGAMSAAPALVGGATLVLPAPEEASGNSASPGGTLVLTPEAGPRGPAGWRQSTTLSLMSGSGPGQTSGPRRRGALVAGGVLAAAAIVTGVFFGRSDPPPPVSPERAAASPSTPSTSSPVHVAAPAPAPVPAPMVAAPQPPDEAPPTPAEPPPAATGPRDEKAAIKRSKPAPGRTAVRKVRTPSPPVPPPALTPTPAAPEPTRKRPLVF